MKKAEIVVTKLRRGHELMIKGCTRDLLLGIAYLYTEFNTTEKYKANKAKVLMEV